MRTLAGKVVAVTGAASGIGRALATELAGRGALVAASDVDEAGLAETAEACRRRGAGPSTAVVDVADRSAVFGWADAVAAEHGRVNVVVNNAGVALGAAVDTMAIEDFEWLMGVNFWGVVHGTQAFLPHLKASGEGHVVNLSSVFGLVSVPYQSAYNAAKFAVRGFTDALRMELEIEGAPVSCTTVHPGGIRTNIARSARVDPALVDLGGGRSAMDEQFDHLARTSPETAARRILDAVEHDRRRLLIGPDAWIIDLVARMPGALYQRAVVEVVRRSGRLRGAPAPGPGDHAAVDVLAAAED